MPGILINTINNSVKEEHVCYFTSKACEKIILYEVIKKFYEHPNSEGMALIERIEIDKITELNRNYFEAASLKLLEYSQQNIRTISAAQSILFKEYNR